MANRAGLVARLVEGEQAKQRDAEHWVAAWERHAKALGPSRRSRFYWDDAWEWITDELALRPRGCRSRPVSSETGLQRRGIDRQQLSPGG